MAKGLSDKQKAEKAARRLRMTEEEKENLLAKQRTARRKRRAEGKIPHRPHVPRTGIALAKQLEAQRVYQAGVRRKRKSTATAATNPNPETMSKLCKGEELVATAGPDQDPIRDARYRWVNGKAVFSGYPKV